MTAVDVFQQLHEHGATLTPALDGTVRCQAPKGVLTPARVETMRELKAELHDLVEAFEERAAIAEYCGGLSRPEAEQVAWESVLILHTGRAA